MTTEPTAQPGGKIPPSEWRAALARAPVEGTLGGSLAGARTGFLRYAIAGGALTGMFFGTVLTHTPAGESDQENSAMLVGLLVGFAIGILIGWSTFRIVERFAATASPRPRVAGTVILGLTIPAYLTAGFVADLVVAVYLGMSIVDAIEQQSRTVLIAVSLSGLITIPLAALYGHRHPTGPKSIVAAMNFQEPEPPGYSRTFWQLGLAAVWFVVGFVVALFMVLVASLPGSMIAIGTLVAWPIIGFVGWKISMRVVDAIRQPADRADPPD